MDRMASSRGNYAVSGMIQSLLSLPMGRQSQTRKGSIKTCRAIKTQHTTSKTSRTLTQWGVDGKRAFDPFRDCALCVARQKKILDKTVVITHQPHHKKCSRNQKTKGRSEWAVQVDSIAAKNIQLNTAPIPTVPNFFNPRNNINNHFTTMDESHKNTADSGGDDDMSVENKDSKESSTKLATQLRE